MIMTNTLTTPFLSIESVEAYLDDLPRQTDETIKRYAGHLASQLKSVDGHHMRDLDTPLVAGVEEGRSNLGQAALTLLEPRYTRLSKKRRVRTWPSPLEAWLQAEVVAAGISGANEFQNGVIVSPGQEERLREQLAASALGMSHEQFMELSTDN